MSLLSSVWIWNPEIVSEVTFTVKSKTIKTTNAVLNNFIFELGILNEKKIIIMATKLLSQKQKLKR
jgi:hypothetical protein